LQSYEKILDCKAKHFFINVLC